MIMDVLLCFSLGNFCKMTGGDQKQVIYRSLNVKRCCGESWVQTQVPKVTICELYIYSTFYIIT